MALGDLVLPPGYVHFTVRLTEATVPHPMFLSFGGRLAGSTLSQSQANALLLNISTQLKPMWPTSVHITALHGLIGSDGPPGAIDASGDVTGTRVGVSLAPPQVAYIIKRTTAFAGRQFRGRLFLPFVNENTVNGAGVLDAAEATLLSTTAQNLNGALVGPPDTGLNSFVILHREPKSGATPAPTTVVAHLGSSTVATQRRRLKR